MKRMIFLTLAFVICMNLCACERMGEPSTHDDNALIGAWYSDAEGILIFKETGIMNLYSVKCGYDDDPTVESHQSTYRLLEDNQFEEINEDFQTTYSYEVNGRVLTLTVSPDEGVSHSFNFTKVTKSSASDDSLVAHWELLGADNTESLSYSYQMSDITFYADGTYVSKRMNHRLQEEEITNSRYTVIHDGKTIEMGEVMAEYWDFEFLHEGVMLMSNDRCQLLYIAQ